MSAVNQAVSADQFLNKLKALDLAPIAYRLMHPDAGLGWTQSQTTQALARYLMFLHLVYLYPERQIIPTCEIDQVWHHHILDTSKYAEDCQMLFGRFLHHFPYLGLRGEADRQTLNMAFAQTQSLFQQHFGADHAQSLPSADCEPLGSLTVQNRPRANLSTADFFPAVLNRWIEVWEQAQKAVAKLSVGKGN